MILDWNSVLEHTPSAIAAIAATIAAMRAKRIEISVNHRLSELLTATHMVAEAAGRAAGIAEERARQELPLANKVAEKVIDKIIEKKDGE